MKDQVVEAIKTGNSHDLAALFIANIDLTVKETADVYSKAQAEQIMRKFFNDHPCGPGDRAQRGEQEQ
ncbi:MAG: DUF4783 domain-containing protein [Flavobacteriales bacterium]|nr:DUF4783 domain-containing protein [Flavobacteriales bacterium]